MTDHDGQERSLSEEDVRAVVRLVGGVAACDDGPVARKKHLMDGLAGLVDADAWLWVVSRMEPGTSDPTALNVMHNGLDERQLALVYEASYDPECPPPEHVPFAQDLALGVPFTRRREDWVPDAEWRGGPHHDKYRLAMGLDEFVYSIFPITDALFSGVGLHRRTGRAPFTTRERRIAHIVVSEIDWLHTAGLPLDRGEALPELSPRHRAVFGLLIQGWNREQIAAHMHISPHTARDHTRAVYRHFGCSGQVDLMRRFMVGDGGDLPPRSR